jgi:hypothetical protein
MPLPTFLVIGPGRSGTSWMYEMLLDHPDVCLARNTKETLFFNQEYERGIDWYERFFEHCGGAGAIGELSNTYMFSEGVPERVHGSLPDVDLVACLRHPFERLRSSFSYKKRAGDETRSLEEAIQDRWDMVEENLYHVQLERFLTYFPRERLHVLLYDDLQEDPAGFLEELYRRIGVRTDHVPKKLHERVNPRARARYEGFGKLLGLASKTLRGVGAYGLLDKAKRNERVRRLFLKEDEDREELSPQTKKWLEEQFVPAVEWVEAYTGRDLSHWKED